MNFIRSSSFLLGFSLLAQTARSQTNTLITPRVKAVIDSTYGQLIKKYKVAGMSLAIVDSGRIVYSTGYGFSDLENKVAATDKTVYRIGSCTKSFTSLSILQLQEKKQLDINAPLKTYLPEFKIENRYGDNPIVLRDMMCHVSGLPCDVLNGFFCDEPPGIDWLSNELAKQTTISPRRYKHAYSNVAYGLLGEVIAKLSGKSYEGYLKSEIFEPLNMKASYVDANKMLSKAFSCAYVNKKRIQEPLIRDKAAGLIHSNVLDMSNYLIMLLNKGRFGDKQILPEAAWEQMTANQVEDLVLQGPESWGYGVYAKELKVKKGQDSSTTRLISHAGDTYAFHADFGFIPALKVGVVLLTNTDRGTYVRGCERLLKLYLKHAKNTTLDVNPALPENDAALAAKGEPCSNTDKKGVYNFNSFVIHVQNPEKIKFKQGPATVILTQKNNDSCSYSIKGRVFGIVPIKIKGQEFKFVKKDGRMYAKGVDTKRKQEEFIAAKSDKKPLPATWKAALGKYTVSGKVYTCTNCPYMNFEGAELTLSFEKGLLKMKSKGKTPDVKNSTYLEVVDERLCTTGGIGRGTGEAVRLLENGNIYYSGFEFKRTN